MENSSFQSVQTKQKTSIGSKVGIAIVIALGFGGIGIFALFFSNFSVQKKSCAEMKKDECQKAASCQSIYNQDGSFDTCITLSSDIVSGLNKDKSLCG